MKRILSLVFLVIVMAAPAIAQQTVTGSNDELVVVKKSDLTTDQLAKVKQQELVDKLGAYKEYAEMGRGVGLAVGESLRAVKDVAIDFSQSDVGKFTMFLIAWKVMAKDVISMGDRVFGYLIGPPLLFFGCLTLIWSYRRQCVPRRVLVEKTKDGKKWEMFYPNPQKIDIQGTVKTEDDVAARGVWAIGHVIVGALFVIFCSLVIFGCPSA